VARRADAGTALVEGTAVSAATVRPTAATRMLHDASWVLAALVTAASLAGLRAPGTYARETAAWASQAMGQDVVNLAVAPLLVLCAVLARRGSLRAHLVWLGLLAYTSYAYLLYAGFLHFTGWFPVYVAAFGLSTWLLVAGTSVVGPDHLRPLFDERTPRRGIGGVLAGSGLLTGALWLAELVPALLADRVPDGVAEAGQVTNPVWLLDLGLVLPLMVATGVLVWNGSRLGLLLAGPLLAFGAVMSAAIVAMQVSVAADGGALVVPPLVVFAALGLVHGTTLLLMLLHLRDGHSLVDALRSGWLRATREHLPTSEKV